MNRVMMMLVPEVMYPLLIAIAGLLMIIGFRKLSLALLGAVLLKAFLGPIIQPLIDSLPPWAYAIAAGIFILYVIRLIWGRRAAEKVTSNALTSIVRAPFRLLGWLVKGTKPW